MTAVARHRQYVASRATTRGIERAERAQRVRQQTSRGEGARIVSGGFVVRSPAHPTRASSAGKRKRQNYVGDLPLTQLLQFSSGPRKVSPMIDYALLLQLLIEAEERVASGVRVIAKQREAIAKLVTDRRVTEDAESLLACYEQAHAMDLANHAHIKDELERTAW